MATDFPPNAMLRISTDERGAIDFTIERLSLDEAIRLFSRSLVELMNYWGHRISYPEHAAWLIGNSINESMRAINRISELEGK